MCILYTGNLVNLTKILWTGKNFKFPQLSQIPNTISSYLYKEHSKQI